MTAIPEGPQEPYMTPELSSEIKRALEGDSNDAEHDALASVADHFGISWTSPYAATYDSAAPYPNEPDFFVWLACEQNNEISEHFTNLDDAKNVIPDEAGARLVRMDSWGEFEGVEV